MKNSFVNMEIKDQMLKALQNRKEDEFNIGDIEYIYDGIDLGKMRKMIGHRGVDLSYDIKTDTINLEYYCYKYYKSNNTDSVLIYLHGGGFYGGMACVVEPICKYLADKGNMHVINVEYDLAPESKFPDIHTKIYEVVKQVKKLYPSQKIVIAGDSAGGHLAMTTALLDEKRIISNIVLYYPVISVIETRKFNIMEYNYNNLGVNAKSVIMFLKSIIPIMKKMYLPNDISTEDKFVNLLNINDFSRLPNIFIAKAQFDYFNLDIDEFCNNANITPIEYEGVAHGFLEHLGYVDEARILLDKTIEAIK